jgi:hypothetical protein
MVGRNATGIIILPALLLTFNRTASLGASQAGRGRGLTRSVRALRIRKCPMARNGYGAKFGPLSDQLLSLISLQAVV